MKTKNAPSKVPATPEELAARRELAHRQARRRRNAALWALLFPLIFTTVIAIGLAAMYYRQMEFFRPSHAGALPQAPLQEGAAIFPTAQC